MGVVKRGIGGASLVALGACVFGVTPVHAQSAPAAQQGSGGTVIEEIVVTAQKRSQDVQSVGIAVTAVSGEQLRQLNIHDTTSISNITPSLYISNIGAQGITTFTIRGVSQNDFADQNEAPNAIYLDGAYNSFIGAAGTNMFDIQRVEVLRGPQGTLFGRNATGGLVQVITNKPTSSFEGYFQVGGGQFGLIQTEGAVSGPITDTLKARFAFSTKQDDGYIKNTLGNPLGGANNYSGRLEVEYDPTDEFKLLLVSHYSRDDMKGASTYTWRRAMFNPSDPAHLVTIPQSQAQYAAFCNAVFGPLFPAPVIVTPTGNCSGWSPPAPGNPYVTATDNPGAMKRDFGGAGATATLKLSDSVTLTSVTDFLAIKRFIADDSDGSSFRLFNFSSLDKGHQLSQELRLNGDTSQLNWVAGGYFIHIDHGIETGIDALPDLSTLINANPGVLFPFKTLNHVSQLTTSYAIFGQAEYRINPLFSVIGGLRFTSDKKRIGITPSCVNGFLPFACAVIAPPGSVQGDGFNDANSGGRNRESVENWSGKAQINYHPNSNLLVYAGVTRGTKGGGFNASAIAGITPAITPYKPEVLTNYEVGFKSTILGGTSRVNGSVFYYDYKNYQAYTLTGLTPTIFNTPATVKGAEIEALTKPVRGLTLSASVAYLDAVAHDVPSNLLGSGVNLGDEAMPQSPRWSANGLARYEIDMFGGKAAVEADARFVGKRFFNTVNHPALSDGGHTVLNSQITFVTGDGRVELAVWGKNLTGAVVYDSGFDLSGTNGSAPLAVEPPRWIGGSITYHFH